MGLHRLVVMIYRGQGVRSSGTRAVGPPGRAKSGHADRGGQRARRFAKPGAKAEAGQVVATFTPSSVGPGIIRLRGADQRGAWGMARAGQDRGPERLPRS